MGVNWISFNNGLPNNIRVTTIAIDTLNKRIYAGMYTLDSSINGIYIYDFKPMLAEDDLQSIPSEFRLCQNYPNPFNPTTTITYMLPARVFVVLTVYDILGRKITTLVESVQDAGEHHINIQCLSTTERRVSVSPAGGKTFKCEKNDFTKIKKGTLRCLISLLTNYGLQKKFEK